MNLKLEDITRFIVELIRILVNAVELTSIPGFSPAPAQVLPRGLFYEG
jgi:hypothetical protein